MQLILAIDTDRRQATQLATLVRQQLAADLVQATSAGEALQALGDRVPDLILTPALLSPFDDGVIAEYLRELGPAGAHVQTLRIPVLGPPAATKSRWSFLFRRSKPAPASSPGCDPEVFADEINLYLTRAAQARQATDALIERDHTETRPSAWDVDSRRTQEPLRGQPDSEIPEPMAWQEGHDWQAPDAWVTSAPPIGDAPVVQPSEWDVIEPVVADEPSGPIAVPDPEPVETPSPVNTSAPPSPTPAAPTVTAADKGSPSFEAALAAIRAAWETPKDTTRTDDRAENSPVSSLR